MIYKNRFPPVERDVCGALPRMSAAQRSKAKALIKGLCCNYSDGDCIYLECVCPQYAAETVMCRYFRHVLLEDIDGFELKKSLFPRSVAERNSNDTDNSIAKKCAVCGKAFKTASQQTKYCEACAKARRTKRQREYMRKVYAKY